MVAVPEVLGANIDEHDAVVPVPARVQGGGVNVPLPPLIVTIPEGVVGVAEVSVTVAVHVVVWPDGIVDGLEVSGVGVVLRGLRLTAFEMVMWEKSPLYDTVMV